MPGIVREARLLEERPRRQDRRDAAALDRRGHRVAAGGEVQVDRRPCRRASPRCWRARRRPTPAAGGRSFVSSGAWRRMARASSRLPTSARPKVSSRPVESAMQNDDHCRFAVRRKREPSVSPSARPACRADSTRPRASTGCSYTRPPALSSVAFRLTRSTGSSPVRVPAGALQLAELVGGAASAPPRATATAARAPARRRRRTGARRRLESGQSRTCASIHVWFLRTRHTRSARSGRDHRLTAAAARPEGPRTPPAPAGPARRGGGGRRRAALRGPPAPPDGWRRRRLPGRAGLLQRLEVDERQVVRQHRAELVGLGLREVALRLDHEEARRHADLEALALGVEPLLGELARGAGRLDPLGVHLDLPRGVAHLLDRARLGALQPLRPPARARAARARSSPRRCSGRSDTTR